ncbi:unnamed protein product [Orchesella dallaii]|uniref:SH3 domain-containing protein n=1 Tax=Orchesella dallaii TaxID=48710 RepID=A0ABP1RFP3_9HEXA
MLLRGIYTFDPRPQDHDQTLPFTCNDNLIFLEVLKRDSNWIKVADILGRVGYVPKDFVEPDEHYLNHDYILSFLADAIVKARQNGLPTARDLERLKDEIRQHPSSVNRRSLEIAKVFRKQESEEKSCQARKSSSDQLVNKRFSRETVRSGKQTRRFSSNYGVNNNPRTPKHPDKSRHFPEVDENPSDSSLRTASDGNYGGDLKRNKTKVKNDSSSSLQELKSELVHVVTARSGLNSKNSENLVFEVLQRIKKTTKDVPVDSLLEKLTISSSSSEIADCGITELDEVMKSLANSSKESIRDCRRSSGRSSSDSSQFSKKLDKLRKLLIECDPFQVTPLLEVGQHKFSHDLVHLYHLESPPSIKERMLDIFLIICTLDKTGRAKLLTTTLPIYLARELMAAKKDGKFCNQLIDLLTVLLSCGESMPETHFEILGTGFVNFVLKELEDAFAKSSGSDINAENMHAFMNLILAYNLQFHASKENIVLKVLAERKRPIGFIEVIIQLFQKATDPLRLDNIKEDYKAVPHATFKMMHDICICQRTVAHLTTSDLKTLVDTIVNGLVENKAGDTRLGYLRVLWDVMGSFHHNHGNIRAALMNIFLDSDPLAFPEQQMIRSMSKEYPALFLQSISRLKTNLDTDNFTQDDGISYLSS